MIHKTCKLDKYEPNLIIDKIVENIIYARIDDEGRNHMTLRDIYGHGKDRNAARTITG